MHVTQWLEHVTMSNRKVASSILVRNTETFSDYMYLTNILRSVF